MASFAEVSHTNNTTEINAPTISVYPNPTMGTINIHGVNSNNLKSITVYSINGKIIFTVDEKTMRNQYNPSLIQIPTDKIGSGIFNLEITDTHKSTNITVFVP